MTQASSLAIGACVLTLVTTTPVLGSDPGSQPRNLRSDNSRIQEVIRFALERSESFQDLVATLDLVDRIVYVREGSCPGARHPPCLHLVAGTPNLVIHIDPRQQTRIAAATLAHELYHAVEIGRAPEVVDGDSLRALYERIGERSCPPLSHHDCWETRAAQAFQELVMRQLTHDRPKTLPPNDK